jgi:hypothetical protein
MKSNPQQFRDFQKTLIDLVQKQNEKLDKLCALLVSAQLLQECVSPDGEGRTAEDCGEIVVESFCASLCLNEELNSHYRNFDYQKAEFFLDDDEDDNDDEDDDEDDNDDEDTHNSFPTTPPPMLSL